MSDELIKIYDELLLVFNQKEPKTSAEKAEYYFALGKAYQKLAIIETFIEHKNNG